MVVKLNDDLAQAIDRHGDVPLSAIHPKTGKVFVLVSEEHYQRLKPLFEVDPLRGYPESDIGVNTDF